jgi:hypothetical protein
LAYLHDACCSGWGDSRIVAASETHYQRIRDDIAAGLLSVDAVRCGTGVPPFP